MYYITQFEKFAFFSTYGFLLFHVLIFFLMFIHWCICWVLICQACVLNMCWIWSSHSHKNNMRIQSLKLVSRLTNQRFSRAAPRYFVCCWSPVVCEEVATLRQGSRSSIQGRPSPVKGCPLDFRLYCAVRSGDRGHLFHKRFQGIVCRGHPQVPLQGRLHMGEVSQKEAWLFSTSRWCIHHRWSKYDSMFLFKLV